MADPSHPPKTASTPLLAAGVAAGWIALVLLSELGFADARGEARSAVREAARYAIEHPEVELPARLLPVAAAVLPGFDGNSDFAFLRRSHRGAAAAQAELDRRVADAFDRVDRLPERALAWVPARPTVAGLLGHPFVHAGWVHALASLALLLLAGPPLERMCGRRLLAASWLLATLLGAAAFAVATGGGVALVGGGAALACSVAALITRFRDRPIRVLAEVPGIAPLHLPAAVLALVWVAYAGVCAWGARGTLPGLPHAAGWIAQAVGATLGVALGLACERLRWEDRYGSGAAAASFGPEPARFELDRVRNALHRGEGELARELLAAEMDGGSRNRDAVALWFSLSVEDGEPERAVAAVAGLVREELRRGAEELALGLWQELVDHVPGVCAEAGTAVRLADAAARRDREEEALALLQQALSHPELPAALAAQSARLAAPLDPPLALEAARRALRGKGLPPGVRVELDALVVELSPPGSDPGPLEHETKELPVDVFYAESDRSQFGAAGDDLTDSDRFPEDAVTEAVPRALEPEHLVVEIPQRGRSEIAYDRVRALSVAGVHGLTARPVVLVDLVLDGAGSALPLAVLRLRSDRFDPRRVAPTASSSLEALRALLTALLQRTRARALPDEDGARARPVRVFASLEEYEAGILRPLGQELR